MKELGQEVVNVLDFLTLMSKSVNRSDSKGKVLKVGIGESNDVKELIDKSQSTSSIAKGRKIPIKHGVPH